MPKAKRIRSAALSAQLSRHEPLGQTIDGKSTIVSRRHKKKKSTNGEDDEDSGNLLLDTKTSQRILELSKSQQLEVEAEEAIRNRREQNMGRSKQHQNEPQGDDDDDSDEEAWLDQNDGIIRNNGGSASHDGGYVDIMEGTLSPEDEALVNAMMKPSSERKSLADIILEKIEEKNQTAAATTTAHSGGLPEKVVHVYTEIGKLLSRYTSGKLPKAFKVIPALTNWEDVLYLTRPDLWTPQAMYAATRIFASNLNPQMAQRFYNLVLLDAVRNDIQYNKKLNYHYYMALKKAVYKPAAFFKGILFALCKDDCSLREAAIVASVLTRVSIPVHHAAVAIHKLAQQQSYTGATSVFLRTLLNKKYALPRPVLSSLVSHFANFERYEDELPVLWHQALLVFVERYKGMIQTDEVSREALRRVMKKHFHHKITPEIRRELFGAVAAWKEDQQQLKKTDMEVE